MPNWPGTKRIVHHGERVEYVEVTLEDIAVVNRLAHEVLGRLLDELAPQTRRLLGLLDAMVREACERQAVARATYRFTRRDVRRFTGWSDWSTGPSAGSTASACPTPRR